MLKVVIPTSEGNKGIQDGSLPRAIEAAREELKAEAAYFCPDEGKRSMLMVFDMKDASQIPLVCERFFMAFNAAVTLSPVMNVDDLRAGLETLAKKR
jgi:hypothetical protein